MVRSPLAQARLWRRRLTRLPTNTQGAVWMLLSAWLFVAMTTLVKYLGSDYSASLQTAYRQGASLLVLTPFILRAPVRILKSGRPGLLLFRAGCTTLGMILQFYSYHALPMADANALSFTRPLWVVPLAALVLGETVGLHRIAAVLCGFVGVLIMLRPGGAQMFGLPQAAALGSSLLFALSITGMKSMTRDHSPITLLAWASILGLLFSLPLALFDWRWPSLGDLGLLALMGGLGIANQACFVRAMSLGDAAAMAPLDYTRLLLSVAVGLFLFQEIPGPTTLIGAGVVAASTLYITLHEQRRARRARIIAELDPSGSTSDPTL